MVGNCICLEITDSNFPFGEGFYLWVCQDYASVISYRHFTDLWVLFLASHTEAIRCTFLRGGKYSGCGWSAIENSYSSATVFCLSFTLWAYVYWGFKGFGLRVQKPQRWTSDSLVYSHRPHGCCGIPTMSSKPSISVWEPVWKVWRVFPYWLDTGASKRTHSLWNRHLLN